MRRLVLYGVADGFVGKLQKSFTRNNRVKKISSEPDAVIKRATSGSRAIGSRPLLKKNECEGLKLMTMSILFLWR